MSNPYEGMSHYKQQAETAEELSPETAEEPSPEKVAKTTAHKAKKSDSDEQVGWVGGLVTLVVIGLLVWGAWSWIFGGDDTVETTATADTENVVENGPSSDLNQQTAGTQESTGTQSGELLGTFYVNASSLNQRGTPGGDVVSKVTRGQAVEVTEVRDGWARVSKDGDASRWVSIEYLSREKPATLPQNRTLTQAPTNSAADLQCQGADKQIDQEMAVTKEALDVYVGPGVEHGKLAIGKATSTTGKTIYRQIYSPAKVREVCRKSEWSYVQKGGPFSFAGWVSSRFLSVIKTDSTGQRIYTIADFAGVDERGAPYIETIVAGVNKIVRENKSCKKVDYADYSVTKSKPGAPVFVVFCINAEGESFNVFFDAADVAKRNKNFAVDPVNKQAAARMCKQHAQSVAAHPSTVRFSVQGYRDHPNGRTTVIGRFSAKNAFNLKITYLIDCLFDSQSMIDVKIIEKAG